MERAPGVQVKEEAEVRRENVFHTRCLVNNQVCSLLSDSGSSTNIVSALLVEKSGLPTFEHPNPYKPQWFNPCGEIRGTKQEIVSLSTGEYEDEILCDVAPMDAGHILLARPWRFDKRVLCDGSRNCCSCELNDQPVILAPAKPCEAREDQLTILSEFRGKGKHKSARDKGVGDTLVRNEKRNSECKTRTPVSDAKSVLFARRAATHDPNLFVPGQKDFCLPDPRSKKRHVQQSCKSHQRCPAESGQCKPKRKFQGHADSRTNPSKEGGTDAKMKRAKHCGSLEARQPTLEKRGPASRSTPALHRRLWKATPPALKARPPA